MSNKMAPIVFTIVEISASYFLTLYRLGAQRVELVSLKGDGEQIIDKAT